MQNNITILESISYHLQHILTNNKTSIDHPEDEVRDGE